MKLVGMFSSAKNYIFIFIVALFSFENFAQQPVAGGLYELYNNYAQDQVIQQQQKLHPPILTPYGWVESSSVRVAQQIVNTPLKQENEHTAEGIVHHQNATLAKPAAPVYTSGMTTEEKIKENNRFIQEELAKQRGYQQPTSQNNFTQVASQEMQYQQLINDLNQEYQLSNYLGQLEYYQSKQYLNDLSHFEKVKDMLKDMLSGKQHLSIKDAYFAVEAAYGNLHLTYEEYNKIISANAKFILLWLTEQELDINNPEALHYGIQRFTNDTLKLTHTKIDDPFSGKFTTTHFPYYYDYIDYRAENDKRNYFVTKTLATGTGQCHTLPIMYLILAEALGVEAYLSYNPQHSFIRFKNNKSVMVNYETTVGQFMTDQFYLETLPVMAKAKRNNLYLQTLSKEQVIATTLLDLAANFTFKHWIGNTSFIEDCLTTANQQFPETEYINTRSHYLHRKLYAYEINNMVQKKGLKGLDEIPNDPEALKLYNEYQAYMNRVNQLGFQDFPEQEYVRMMEYHDIKGKLQISKKIDTKTKKSLFLTY